MKTPSAYPVLDNRPIDQWKVTELKEELKRRKLTTRGLKEELIRRLDESLRSEMEAEKEEAGNGVKDPESDNIAEAVVIEQSGNEAGELSLDLPGNAKDNVGDSGDRTTNIGDTGDTTTNVGDAGDATTNVADAGNVTTTLSDAGDVTTTVGDAGDVTTTVGDAGDVTTTVGDAGDVTTTVGDAGGISTNVCDAGDITTSVGNAVDITTNVGDDGDKMTVLDSVQVHSKDSIEQPVDVKGQEEQELGLVSDQPLELGTFTANDISSAGLGNDISEGLSSENALNEKGLPDGKMERDDEGSRVQEQAEELKPLHEDGKLDSSDSNNQVSEVSSSLGFPIKSNSISTDSVSINEKNDLKDNIIADNVKLESDVKPEMVQPSSSELVPDSGKSHPRDVEEPYENKESVQDTDNNVTNADLSQKNYSADLGSSEKLNLDRSSGDDSMEEDALESKHIDSNYNSEEVVERTEKKEVPIKEERPVATMDIDEPEKEKDTNYKNNVVDTALTDKRKLSDQEAVLNNEPTKRQRRWKSESNNVKEPQISNIPLQMAVDDVPKPAVLKRNLSGFDSTGGANESPKEREVPPSSKPATDSLRIDRFLRPFTLKAVQELLAKTGSITSFWMDHIKTHCYVTYSSVEEAMETRNAIYNLQWPPNGGRHLVAEFVDPEEVKARLEKPPPSPATPVSSGPTVPEPSPTLLQPSPRQQSTRQQMTQHPTLPPPPPLSNPPQAREYAVPPPPPQTEKVEAPILTLDDLFKKTKATPRIYYLPLSEEQVSRVLEARSKDSKQ